MIDHVFNADIAGEDFETLFATSWKKLYIVAYNRLKDECLAKDMVQEVFVYYLSNYSKINILTNAEAYLHKALQYQIIAHYRKNVIHTKAVDFLLTRMNETELKMHDLLTEKDLAKTLTSEIDTMPDSMGKVFKLKLKDYSVEEIALETGMTEKTIRNNISMGLHRLRKALIKDFPEDFSAICFILISILGKDF